MLQLVAITLGVLIAQSSTQSGSLRSAIESAKSQCEADIQKHCSDVTPGEGRVAACLESKDDQLSDACRAARLNLASVISERMDKATVAFRKSCGSDVKKFCADVPPGRGRILNCLNDHQDNLSDACLGFQAKLAQRLNQTLG
jgi:Golgi apparatus protein 1